MKDPMYKLDIKPGINYGMEKGLNKGMEATPLAKHSSGIGPANLGGPGMKSHVHACGTPKMSSGLNDGHSGLNDGHEDTALPNLGFIKAKTLEKNPNAKTMKVGGKEMPITD